MCRFQKTYNTLDLLDKERSTWQLLRSLFKDHLDEARGAQAAEHQGLDEDMSDPKKPVSGEGID